MCGRRSHRSKRQIIQSNHRLISLCCTYWCHDLLLDRNVLNLVWPNCNMGYSANAFIFDSVRNAGGRNRRMRSHNWASKTNQSNNCETTIVEIESAHISIGFRRSHFLNLNLQWEFYCLFCCNCITFDDKFVNNFAEILNKSSNALPTHFQQLQTIRMIYLFWCI